MCTKTVTMAAIMAFLVAIPLILVARDGRDRRGPGYDKPMMEGDLLYDTQDFFG